MNMLSGMSAFLTEYVARLTDDGDFEKTHVSLEIIQNFLEDCRALLKEDKALLTEHTK